MSDIAYFVKNSSDYDLARYLNVIEENFRAKIHMTRIFRRFMNQAEKEDLIINYKKEIDHYEGEAMKYMDYIDEIIAEFHARGFLLWEVQEMQKEVKE